MCSGIALNPFITNIENQKPLMLLGEGMTEVAIIIIQSTIRTIIKGKSKILSIILNANGNNKHLNNSKVDVCTKFFPSGFKESCRRKNGFQSQRIRRI